MDGAVPESGDGDGLVRAATEAGSTGTATRMTCGNLGVLEDMAHFAAANGRAL